MENTAPLSQVPWNKGKLVGQKPPSSKQHAPRKRCVPSRLNECPFTITVIYSTERRSHVS
jgi:hypothetical protein